MKKIKPSSYNTWFILNLETSISATLMLKNFKHLIGVIYSYSNFPNCYEILEADEKHYFIKVVDISLKESYWYIEEGDIQKETLIRIAKYMNTVQTFKYGINSNYLI